MNITLDTKPNRTAVAYVAGGISKRTSLPILSQFRVGGNAEEVTLMSTDLDVTLVCILETDGPRTNEPCCLPAERLAKLFKTGNRLSIDSNCNVAAVTMDGNAFTLQQMPVADYPVVPKFKASYAFELSAEALVSGLGMVAGAISSDESRYVLNGVFFRVEPDMLTLVATDGRRLHTWATKREASGLDNVKRLRDGKEDFILPKGTLPHLLKLLKAQPKGGTVCIESAENRIRISGERLLLLSKVIEGNYPNYRQVIPDRDNVKERFEIDVPAWITALRTVEPFTSEKHVSVKLALTKHLATFTTQDPDLGTGKATVAINYAGKDCSSAWNPAYLIEALTPHKDATYQVQFGFTDELTPCVITSPTTTTVVMPMRLS